MIQGQQLPLFNDVDAISHLDSRLWQSKSDRDSSIQRLGPYPHTIRPGMAKALVALYTEPGDVVLDPFCGSGVVAFEAAVAERFALAADLNPYAHLLTLGKLSAPYTLAEARARAIALADMVQARADSVDIERMPKWLWKFFHPVTLREVIAAVDVLTADEDYFMLSCLLMILHGTSPGVLSYPAGYATANLRLDEFPPEAHPDLYTYRDLRSRLLKQVDGIYSRSGLIPAWNERKYNVWLGNGMTLPLEDVSVDAVITQPPHPGAFNYVLYNTVRLFFLGIIDPAGLEASMTTSREVFIPQMALALREMARVLKPGKHAVLVFNDILRDGKPGRLAELVGGTAEDATAEELRIMRIFDDLPESNGNGTSQRYKRILVLGKAR